MPHRKGGKINKRVHKKVQTEHQPHSVSESRTNQTQHTDRVNDKITNHQNYPELQVEIAIKPFMTAQLQLKNDTALLQSFYIEIVPWYRITSDKIFNTDKVDTNNIPDSEKEMLKTLSNISNKQIMLIYCVIGKLIISIFPQITQNTDAPLTEIQSRKLIELLFPFDNSPIEYKKALEVVSLCIQFFCLNNKTKFRNRIDGYINHPKHLNDANGNFHENFTVSILTILKCFKMTYLGHFTQMELHPALQNIADTPMQGCQIN